MSINQGIPLRGEVWLANFDPTLGSEIKKVRPAIIISSNAVGKLPIKLVAPVTDWKPYFSRNIWHIQILPSEINGLSKPSAADVLQLIGLAIERFIRRLGCLSEDSLRDVVASVSTVIEFE